MFQCEFVMPAENDAKFYLLDACYIAKSPVDFFFFDPF